jgi:hypothetical protein
VPTDGVKDVVRSFYAEVINERRVNAIDELLAQLGQD